MRNKTILSKDFLLVVVGQIISVFGNQILRYALPLYLLNKTGSATLFGTILATSMIPMILLFPIGGIVADRVNKRNIMVILDFSTAALIGIFYWLEGLMDIVPLMAITMIALYGIQGAYQPAVQASVPVLVEKEQLMKANSIVNLINSMASMGGPVVGGILFSIVGLTPILYVGGGCFLAAAVMETLICIPFEKKEAASNIVVTGFSDLKESFHFMFRVRPILWKGSLIYASMGLLLTALILISVPVLITQHLGFAQDTANRLYGYAQGVIAAGAILGGLMAGLLSNRLKAKASPVLLIGGALSVLMVGIALQVLKSPAAIYLILLTGSSLLTALSTIFQIQIMSHLQLMTPRHLIGKVISCFICACMSAIPLGQFIYGFVFEHIGNKPYLPFYIAAAIMLGIAVFTHKIFYGMDRIIEQTVATE